MPAIQDADHGSTVRVGRHSPALTRAALAALQAPSILNTQPWSWRIDHDTAELHADRGRQLPAVDPDGRLLTLSCGVALHHARVVLAAEGCDVEVTYLPDPARSDLLATLTRRGTGPIRPDLLGLRRAISLRRTDRRPFADLPVPDGALDRLTAAATAAGAHAHVVRARDLVDVAVAAGHAANVQQADPAYREDLAAWVRADGAERDGVPLATTTPAVARPVPIRDFAGTGEQAPSIYSGTDVADRDARYLVLYTDGDEPRDWLAAGEALSAVLLTATADGLAASPMSDLVENLAARDLLRRMLGNIGHPAVVLRVGVPGRAEPAPAAPRRSPVETVEVVDEPFGTRSDVPADKGPKASGEVLSDPAGQPAPTAMLRSSANRPNSKEQ